MKECANKCWVKQFSHDIDKLDRATPNNLGQTLKAFVKAWILSMLILMMVVPIALSFGHGIAADISAAKELAEGTLK